jgi:hypothetical protein
MLTRDVVANLRAIAARDPSRDARVFIKIGDSITTDPSVDGAFGCFASGERAPIDLGGRESLRATIDWFDQVQLPGGRKPSTTPVPTSWNRDSWVARVGVDSAWPLQPESEPGWGGLRPLDKELTELGASKPRFAVYMLGTNDLCSSPDIASANPAQRFAVLGYYARQVTRAVEWTTSRGIIPVLTYFPPILSCPKQSLWYSPTAAAIVRGVATAKKVPTIDAYSALEAFAVDAVNRGNRSGAPAFHDGVHPASAEKGECDLSAPALAFGRNDRALRTLEVLDKLRTVFSGGAPSADPEPSPLAGRGSAAEPIVIPSLPFAHAAPSAGIETGRFDDYTSCGGSAGQTGNETVLRLDLSVETPVRALALPGECPDGACAEESHAHLALFRQSVSMSNCVAAGEMIERRLAPGRYFWVLDSAAGSAQPKTSVLTLHRCLSNDQDCG